ncbi:Acyl-coenzyme A synthetase acsm3, mitochondrial [Branchiostoma belcheri]|nr:Acyl-coenzyme A synthetase acsm3, mitochondrial [Branchiostoma belcheri]
MAEHTHASYGLGHVITGRYWLDLTPNDVIWNMSDTGWAKSAYSNLFGPWVQGACVFIHHTAKFDPVQTLKILSSVPINTMCTPPTAYRMMIQNDLSRYDLSKLEHVVSAGEPLNDLSRYDLSKLEHVVSAGEPLNDLSRYNLSKLEHVVSAGEPLNDLSRYDLSKLEHVVSAGEPLNDLSRYNLSKLEHVISAGEPLNDLSRYNLSKLEHVVSAGEPLNPEVMSEWKAGTGLTIREGYGQSETCLACGMFRCLDVRPGSMGKPAPGYDLRVIDDKCQEVQPGKEGDLAIKVKPQLPVGLFTRYLDDPVRTAGVFRGDYYVMGDRGLRDEDGYLWFVGRADDVILSAGYRIGPFEVESALIEHPAVAESAVVSSPDNIRGESGLVLRERETRTETCIDLLGPTPCCLPYKVSCSCETRPLCEQDGLIAIKNSEVVKAFIILSPSYRDVGQKEELIKDIQEHVKKTTAPYKYPRQYLHFSRGLVHCVWPKGYRNGDGHHPYALHRASGLELPKTVSGKIRRVELRTKEWEKKS